MELFKIEFTLIIMMCFTAITISEDLEIFRARSDGDQGWTKGTDSFKVPPSLCDQDTSNSVTCARFSADVQSENGEQCFCSCSNENATLMFNNKEWKCLKNADVRVLLGYNRLTYTRFYKEDNNNELRMLNISDRRQLSLARQWPQCLVDEESSWYIGCNGSEVPFRSSLFTIQKTDQNTPYVLQVNKGVSDAEFLRGRIIKLGIRCTAFNIVFKMRLLFKYEGQLTCPISTPTVQPSVITKTLNATMTLSPSTITRTTKPLKNSATKGTPSIISVVFPTVSDIPRTISFATSTVPEVSSTVSDTPPTIPDILSTISYTSSTVSVVLTAVSGAISSTSPSTTDVRPTVSNPPPTVSDTPPTVLVPVPTTQDTTTVSSTEVLTRPSPGSERRTDNNSSSLGLMAGLPASILAVVLVGVLVYRRRHLKKNPSSSTSSEKGKETVIMSAQTSSAFETDDENAYKELDFREPPIYASNYQVPHINSQTHFAHNDPHTDQVYAPLNISESQNIYGHGNIREPLYRALENPGYDNDRKSKTYGRAISIEQPVYNLMEELSTPGANGPVQDGVYDDQPVYNVLEEPYLEDSEGPGHYDAGSPEEPVYNTLEESYVTKLSDDPKFINEPIYNVLEEKPYPEVLAEGDNCGSRPFV